MSEESYVRMTDEQLVAYARRLMDEAGDDVNTLSEKANVSPNHIKDALHGGDNSTLERIIYFYAQDRIQTYHYIRNWPGEQPLEDALERLSKTNNG